MLANKMIVEGNIYTILSGYTSVTGVISPLLGDKRTFQHRFTGTRATIFNHILGMILMATTLKIGHLLIFQRVKSMPY